MGAMTRSFLEQILTRGALPRRLCRAFLPGLAFVFGLGLSTAVAGGPARVSKHEVSTGKFLVVFASNLMGSGGCTREDPSGADLFSALFDLSTDRAEKLVRLTSTPGQTEWFPSISPDRRFIAYMTARPSRGPLSTCDIRLLDFSSGSDVLLRADARFPAFSKDGRWLAYSAPFYSERGIWMGPFGPSRDGSLTLGEPRLVTGRYRGQNQIDDPEFFPDGDRVAFHHRQNPATGASIALASTDGKDLVEITPRDGSCHPTIRPDGLAVAFSRSTDGRACAVYRTGREWATPVALPFTTLTGDYRPYDPRFGSARNVHLSYMRWLANDLMLVTVHGSDRPGHFSFARLFMFQWTQGASSVRVHDFSGAVEALAGAKSRDFCTGDAAEVR
jgi:Tol biopolymer transport system component